MLAFIIDLILIAILLIGIIIGLKRGFIASISKHLRRIFALVIAFGCASVLGAALIQPIISEPVTSRITEILYENCPDITADTASEELPLVLRIVAVMSGVDIGASTEGVSDVVAAAVDALSSPVIQAISTVISFVLLFILSNLLLRFLFYLIDRFSQDGLLGFVNKALGCFLHLLLCFAIDWVLVSIFAFLIDSAMLSTTEWAINFNGGFIYRLFNELNPLELLLKL